MQRFGSDLAVDVAVVGRGPVGAAAALGFARQGLRVALIGTAPAIGRRDDADWDPRVFALSPGTRGLLDELRVWGALDASRIAPVYDMRIWPDASATAPQLHFDAFEARIEALAWIVEGDNVNRALSTAVGFAPVEAIDAHVTGFGGAGREHSELSLSDGRAVRARLVIGADGGDSPLRRLAGLAATERAYPQTAVVANFETDRPHADCALQWFGEHGVLALLPLPGQRCSMVWSAPHALAHELCGLAPQALADRVHAAAHGRLGEMRLLAPVAAFPLRLVEVEPIVGARVALVGDAAHVVHPLAGQGLNLGFGDVAALLEVVGGRERFRDPGDPLLLRRYARARKEAVAAMRLATDGLQRLFDADALGRLGPAAVPLAAIRDAGWRLVAGSGWLKRRLMSSAATS